MRHRLALAVVAAALVAAAPAHAAPGKLTVGDRARPLNVEGAPRFGWMPDSPVQTAYEIKVSKDGADVWDSGKVASSAQSYVP
jgi:alpha-L-rhamnosidase